MRRKREREGKEGREEREGKRGKGEREGMIKGMTQKVILW